MIDLSKFVSKHYNVSDSELPKVATEVQSRLVGDGYLDLCNVDEYMLYDLVDEVLCDLDITE